MIAKVCVIGLGYVGLPLASLIASKEITTIGYDLNEKLIDDLNNKKIHIKDEKIESIFLKAYKKNNLKLTNNFQEAKNCNFYIVCVPTPVDLDNKPVLEPLTGAVKSIAPFLEKGDHIVIESTVFPGTCEDILLPIINNYSELSAQEINLSHCPERVNPGDDFWFTDNIPRVIGSLHYESSRAVAEFYSSILGGPIHKVENIKNIFRPKFYDIGKTEYGQKNIQKGSITIMNSIRDAEAVKAMENTVRDVNIAFVNELAKISNVLDLNIVEIIDGMSTKPFGKGPYYPGIGVGGHCIAVDPEWLKDASIKAGYFPKIIEMSRQMNSTMPNYSASNFLELIKDKIPLNTSFKLTVLGVAYKKNINDDRESPFYDVKKYLNDKNVEFEVFDPLISKENTVKSFDESIKYSDGIILVTDHDFLVKKINSLNFQETNIKFILDGRNALEKANIDSSVNYIGIGQKR